MLGLLSILSLFRKVFDKFNNSIYRMTLKLFLNAMIA